MALGSGERPAPQPVTDSPVGSVGRDPGLHVCVPVPELSPRDLGLNSGAGENEAGAQVVGACAGVGDTQRRADLPLGHRCPTTGSAPRVAIGLCASLGGTKRGATEVAGAVRGEGQRTGKALCSGAIAYRGEAAARTQASDRAVRVTDDVPASLPLTRRDPLPCDADIVGSLNPRPPPPAHRARGRRPCVRGVGWGRRVRGTRSPQSEWGSGRGRERGDSPEAARPSRGHRGKVSRPGRRPRRRRPQACGTGPRGAPAALPSACDVRPRAVPRPKHVWAPIPSPTGDAQKASGSLAPRGRPGSPDRRVPRGPRSFQTRTSVVAVGGPACASRDSRVEGGAEGRRWQPPSCPPAAPERPIPKESPLLPATVSLRAPSPLPPCGGEGERGKFLRVQRQACGLVLPGAPRPPGPPAPRPAPLAPTTIPSLDFSVSLARSQ